MAKVSQKVYTFMIVCGLFFVSLACADNAYADEPITLSLTIEKSSDDAVYHSAFGYKDYASMMVGGSGTLENPHIQTTGWIFRNLNIPKSSEIEYAELFLYPNGMHWGAIKFDLHASLESETFSLSNSPSQRVLSQEKILRDVSMQQFAGQKYGMGDFALVIQEMVNSEKWSAGSDVAIIARSDYGGHAQKSYVAYNGNPSESAQLIIRLNSGAADVVTDCDNVDVQDFEQCQNRNILAFLAFNNAELEALNEKIKNLFFPDNHAERFSILIIILFVGFFSGEPHALLLVYLVMLLSGISHINYIIAFLILFIGINVYYKMIYPT